MSKEKPKAARIINYVLWVAFLLALGASIQHLAWTFGTVERYPVLGWIAAVAVDAGLAALAYSIQQRRRAKRPALVLWLGVAFFAGISALANFYHALSVEIGAVPTLQAVGWLILTKAVLLSATLPAMVIYLGEIVSSDDLAEADRVEREAAKEAAKDARRIEAEQRAEQLKAAEAQKPAEPVFKCPDCERIFKTKNALNGHTKAHKVEATT